MKVVSLLNSQALLADAAPESITKRATRTRCSLFLGCLSSIHNQHMSSDEIGSVGRQKDGCALQIIFASETAQWHSLQEGLPVSLDDNFRHICREPSGSNGIHLDIVNAPFARQVFRETDDATLAAVIADSLQFGRRSTKAGDGRNIDDLAAFLRNQDLAHGLR